MERKLSFPVKKATLEVTWMEVTSKVTYVSVQGGQKVTLKETLIEVTSKVAFVSGKQSATVQQLQIRASRNMTKQQRGASVKSDM